VDVGRLRIPTGLAVTWLRDYLDGATNQRSSEPYAYPAYDLFDVEDNDPHRLKDADLLAPILLNVKVTCSPSTLCSASEKSWNCDSGTLIGS